MCLVQQQVGNIVQEDTFFNWLNSNQGAVMVILTLVYVITTVLLLFSNRKIRTQNRDIQKQNVRIQLFEKRYEVYEEIESLFSELRRKRFSVIKVMVSEDEDHSYDLGFRRIRHLFGTKNFEQAEDTLKLTFAINQKISELKQVYEYIVANMDKEGEFKQNLNIAPNSIGNAIIDEDVALCDKYRLNGIKLGLEPPRNYNYCDIYIEINQLLLKFNKDYNKLLSDMENELHIGDVEV